MNSPRREIWDAINPSDFQKHRFNEILAAFDGRSDGPSMGDLSRESGVTRGVLRPAYRSARSFDKVQAIVVAAAALLRLDEGDLARWVYGADLPQLDQHFIYMTSPKCTACGEIGDPEGDDWIWQTSIHKSCQREVNSPHMVQWAEEVTAAIVGAPLWLQRAWEKARADRLALTYTRLAELGRRELAEVKRVWGEVPLPPRPARGISTEAYGSGGGLSTRRVMAHVPLLPFRPLSVLGARCPEQQRRAPEQLHMNWRMAA